MANITVFTTKHIECEKCLQAIRDFLSGKIKNVKEMQNLSGSVVYGSTPLDELDLIGVDDELSELVCHEQTIAFLFECGKSKVYELKPVKFKGDDPIEVIGLSAPLADRLKQIGIQTVGVFSMFSNEELEKLTSFNEQIKEAKAKLQDRNN